MKEPISGSISLKLGYDLLKKSGPWQEKDPADSICRLKKPVTFSLAKR